MTVFISASMSGTIPRQNARHLSNAHAQTATDVDLLSGVVAPLMAETSIGWINTVAGTIASIYRFGTNTPNPKFIEWLAAGVDVVRSATANNTNERTYYTGDGTPKKLDATRVDVAGNITPLEMGIPAPTVAPTAAAVSANTNTSINVDVSYVYTFVSAWGEESPPSLPSTQITFDTTIAGIQANISNLPVAAPAGAYNIVNIRIYRTAVGITGTQYQFVAELPVGTLTYGDAKKDTGLGEVLSTTTFTPPPATMEGLIALPNGIMAAFNGSDLLFCEPYQPHAWPIGYMLSVDSPIVGLAAFGNSVLITTQGSPYVVTGVHPSMMTMQKMEVNQSCLSKSSIVDMGYYATYASPDGLVTVGGSGANVITLPLFTVEQWRALNPSSIHGYYSDSRYVGFYDATAIGGTKGGFILDPANPDIGVVWLSAWFQSGYSDPLDDTLYLMTQNIPGVQVGNIVSWNKGVTPKPYIWKSKVHVAAFPTALSCGQVRASVYPVTLKVFADGILKHTQSVLNELPFRLPSGFRAIEWEYEATGTATIYSIAIASSMTELGQVAV